jgi:predicted site-specific integrase-resolvase
MKDVIEYQGQEHVSPAFIANYYGVCRQTIYRWRRHGWLAQPIRLGGLTYYARDDIERRLVKE